MFGKCSPDVPAATLSTRGTHTLRCIDRHPERSGKPVWQVAVTDFIAFMKNKDVHTQNQLMNCTLNGGWSLNKLKSTTRVTGEDRFIFMIRADAFLSKHTWAFSIFFYFSQS